MISVIVPVYNVEEYLNKCIESIVQQTYTNLEIILVDDGSTDNGGIICDEWSKKDKRIKVIHKKNGGLSDARNFGVDIATGDFIGFVDSDDWIDERMYEVLLNSMLDNQCDIACCDVKMIWEDGRVQMLTPQVNTILRNKDAMKSIILEDLLKQPVWYKLYKADIARVKFEVGKIHEDNYWSYQVIAKTNAVSIVNEPLYYYRQRENSIMGNSFNSKRLDALGAMKARCEFIDDNYPELSYLAKKSYAGYCMYLYQVICRSDLENSTNLKNEIFNNFQHIDKFYNHTLNTQNVWFLLFNIMPNITCNIRNKLKIGI